jgi:hypothetical protein
MTGTSINPKLATQYNECAAAAYFALVADLTPAQRALLDELVRQIDNAVMDRYGAEVEHEWRCILAHVPGLAPTLYLLRAHVQRVPAPCRPLSPGGVAADDGCSLASDPGPFPEEPSVIHRQA